MFLDETLLSTFLIQLAGSFIASSCFGILASVPRKELVFSGLAGMVAWSALWIVRLFHGSDILGTFLGSSAMGFCAYLFAKRRKMPVTMYSIPGIFPLVPGIMIYRTFKSFFDNEVMVGIDHLMHTFIIGFAIAGGLMVAELLQRIVGKVRLMLIRKNN